MESSGEPGRIQLSAEAAALLRDDFTIDERGTVEVKGKGKMQTYWLLGSQETKPREKELATDETPIKHG